MEGGPGFDGMNPVVQTMGGIKGEEEEEIKEGCWFVVDVGLMMTGWRVVMMITENKERESRERILFGVRVCGGLERAAWLVGSLGWRPRLCGMAPFSYLLRGLFPV